MLNIIWALRGARIWREVPGEQLFRRGCSKMYDVPIKMSILKCSSIYDLECAFY